MDGKPWPSNDIPLYKPLGSNGTFVRCQRCSDRGRQPSWVNSNDEDLPFCGDKMSHLLCANHTEDGVRDIIFFNFTRSQVGSYTCKQSNEMDIIINALSLHPINQLTSNRIVAKPLNCETTGNGSITYQWETSNINGGQWMNISNSNSSTLVVGTLEESQQYRCVVSNEAGSTRSNVATVTVLSKYMLVPNKTI